MSLDFDIIVVGAGHAGVEAALSSSKLGKKTLLVTTNLDRIGYMSCNPSIGGLGKGHMVREIDVLGGQMGFVADQTCIQFKRLNSRRGPAVRGSRVQSDKDKYSLFLKTLVLNTENLSVIEGEVKSLILADARCMGIKLDDGSEVHSLATVITAGTFMNGVMHVGTTQTPGGRVGDKASIGLSDQLADFGFDVRRLKTGTPPRLLKESIDWSVLSPEFGDDKFFPFSLKSAATLKLPQVACHISRTNEKTHDIIRSNLDKSPMYAGIIEGTGPRYCPSVEDKVVRFADRTSHQTFLEPEGLDSDLIYLQGISTSLPVEIQLQFLRTMRGLENVKIARYGYAVEYDFIEPTQIFHSLETRVISNLFLAGQINGTSGYEEAASQGLIAGINAVRKIEEEEPLILKRHESYIGVLIDDLVTKGTTEPYRMFTSRAEHRLVLREDNVFDRLSSISTNIGLQTLEVLERASLIIQKRNLLKEKLSNEKIYPSESVQQVIESMNSSRLTKSLSFEEFLRRPEIVFNDLGKLGFDIREEEVVHEAVEIFVKYNGYIHRQNLLIEATKSMDEFLIGDLDFIKVKGLSNEEVEKLSKVRPRTLGQASRISGVNPSAIQCILIYSKGLKTRKDSNVVRMET